MKNIIFWLLKCGGFIAVVGLFSGCATNSNMSENHSREPIFIDAKDRQGCKIAHFFNQNDDEKPLNEKIAIASNAEIVWEGECKDGYANGVGVEITQDENGAKRALIAIYTERIPRYVYRYELKGDESTLFMGAFGDIFDYEQSHHKYGLSVENNGKKLRLQSSRADIVFDSTALQILVNGYELRNILLDTQKAEHTNALKLIRDYKGDLAQSIANYGESLALAQQYSDKICGESTSESKGESVVDSGADSSVDSANQNADLGVDSVADSIAIHHREICALKINYNAEVEIMQKLVEFLSEL